MNINRELIQKNSTLRRYSRDQLRGKWGTALLLCLISTIIMAIVGGIVGRFLPGSQALSTLITNGREDYSSFIGSSMGHSYLTTILNTIISAPLALGLISCFINLVRDEDFRFEGLFDGFKNFSSALILKLLMFVFTTLWTLFFIIPGIIAGYRYSMAFYILNDNPEIGAMEAIKTSKKMMKGYKWKLFCLHFSFLGWAILCSIFTLFIGFLWLIPYIQASIANFYQNLKDASETPVEGNEVSYE